MNSSYLGKLRPERDQAFPKVPQQEIRERHQGCCMSSCSEEATREEFRGIWHQSKSSPPAWGMFSF